MGAAVIIIATFSFTTGALAATSTKSSTGAATPTASTTPGAAIQTPPGVQQAIDSAKGAMAATQQALGFWDKLKTRWLDINKSIEGTIGFSPATAISFLIKVVIWILQLGVKVLQYIIKGLEFLTIQ
jgi:hypothetical protein